MTENLLEQARTGGFNYQLDAQGLWQITAKLTRSKWELRQVAEQEWVLLINQVAQINFNTTDAIAFLKRRSATPSPQRQPLISLTRTR